MPCIVYTVCFSRLSGETREILKRGKCSWFLMLYTTPVRSFSSELIELSSKTAKNWIVRPKGTSMPIFGRISLGAAYAIEKRKTSPTRNCIVHPNGTKMPYIWSDSLGTTNAVEKIFFFFSHCYVEHLNSKLYWHDWYDCYLPIFPERMSIL